MGWDSEDNQPTKREWLDGLDRDLDAYFEDAGPSLSRLALLHDSGKACGECGAEFTAANGVPSSCETCKNMGSEYPLTQHPEVTTEAHKHRARQRRKAKESK